MGPQGLSAFLAQSVNRMFGAHQLASPRTASHPLTFLVRSLTPRSQLLLIRHAVNPHGTVSTQFRQSERPLLSFPCLVILQILIKYLLCAMHCAVQWATYSEKEGCCSQGAKSMEEEANKYRGICSLVKGSMRASTWQHPGGLMTGDRGSKKLHRSSGVHLMSHFSLPFSLKLPEGVACTWPSKAHYPSTPHASVIQQPHPPLHCHQL